MFHFTNKMYAIRFISSIATQILKNPNYENKNDKITYIM